MLQGGKSVFKMKSGLRPVLEKSEGEIKINFVYKKEQGEFRNKQGQLSENQYTDASADSCNGSRKCPESGVRQ